MHADVRSDRRVNAGDDEVTAVATTETVLRPLLRADLPAAHALSSAFNWPHRLDDWAFMHALGRGAVVDRAGQVVGTALCWHYGTDRAALGMVGVAPTMQGQGMGRKLMETTLGWLGNRAALLYATEAGLPLYRSLGFVATGRARQHQGAAFQDGLVPLPEGERLRPIGRSDASTLAALDLEASGMERQAVLMALLEAATGVVLDRDGKPTGFALLRRFGQGHVIGPVVAPDATGAKALIGYFLGSRPGQFIRIDVPEESDLSSWLEELGLADIGSAFRMIRGRDTGPGGRVSSFALISQAFG